MASFNKVNMSLDDIIKNDRGERKNLQVVKSGRGGRGGPRNFGDNSNRNFNNRRRVNLDQNPRNSRVFNNNGNDDGNRFNRNSLRGRMNRGLDNQGPQNFRGMNNNNQDGSRRFRKNFNEGNNNPGRRFRNFNNYENENNNEQGGQVGIFNIL